MKLLKTFLIVLVITFSWAGIFVSPGFADDDPVISGDILSGGPLDTDTN